MVKVPRCKAETDRQTDALGEAKMVADWADETTPEWVRAIGALREAFAGTKHEKALDDEYAGLLAKLSKSRPDPTDEFAVVIRQLRERDYLQAALIAARTGADLDDKNSYLASAAANCASAVGDKKTALYYILRAAEIMDADQQPDAQRAWESVLVRAEAVGDAGAIARAKERIETLSKE